MLSYSDIRQLQQILMMRKIVAYLVVLKYLRNLIEEADESGQVNSDYIYFGSVPISRADEWWEGMKTPDAPIGANLIPGDKQLSVSWNANQEPVDGYKVYWGTESGKYTNSIDVGKVNSHTITGLTNGVSYYIAVTAYTDIKETYYYHTDHLGTAIMMTDKSQTVVWQGEFKPFGEQLSITGSVINNKRLPGQYYDKETGKHDNGFRTYNPPGGTYLQRDPIGFEGGDINLFRYAKSNPLMFIDPFGLEWLLISFRKYWDPAVISAPSHEPSIPNKVECIWKCSSEKVTTMGKCSQDKKRNMYYNGTQFWINCCCPDPNKNLKGEHCEGFMCPLHSPEPAHGPEGPFLPATPNPTPPGLPPVGK